MGRFAKELGYSEYRVEKLLANWVGILGITTEGTAQFVCAKPAGSDLNDDEI